MKVLSTLALISAAVAPALAHYRWNALVVNGVKQADWQHVRTFSNYNDPVTDVASLDIRCNRGGSISQAATATVNAGSTLGITIDQAIYHKGVINVYLAKAPGTAAAFDGAGSVWFKVAQLAPITNGGSTITFPSDGLTQFNFKIPSATPTGQYVARIEHIGLHDAARFGGAQFFISCANLNIVGGGSGNPGPKVAFPGYYTGNESGLKLDIYWPIPATYAQPGPAVWSG